MTGYASEFAIEIEQLTKRYASKRGSEAKLALEAVDLAVPRGSMFALLGPNGAGKSTMINILAGIIDPTSAHRIEVEGRDQRSDPLGVKRRLGVVPQELVMDPLFTPQRSLDLHAGLYGVPAAARKTEELLRAFSLWDKRDVTARRLSGGMKRRLMTCKALIHQPSVLILDEPTAGVDIELRHQLWEYVRELNASGTTILLTTHYLEEAEELCDEVAIINHGKIVERDRTENLLDRFGDKRLALELDTALETLPPLLVELGAQIGTDGRHLALPFEGATARLPEIVGALAEVGRSVKDISTPRKDLAEVFLDLTRD